MENNKKTGRKVYGKPAGRPVIRPEPHKGPVHEKNRITQSVKSIDSEATKHVVEANVDNSSKTLPPVDEEVNNSGSVNENNIRSNEKIESVNIGENSITTQKNGGFEAKIKGSEFYNYLNKDLNDDTTIIHRGGVDIPLLMIFVCLISFGLIMVFSASYAYSYNKFGNSYDFILDQIFFALIGGVVALLILWLYDFFMNKKMIRFFVVMYFLLLLFLLVLVIFFGTSEDEAQRWLPLFGFNVQPSEFMKGGLVLFLAMYYSMYNKTIKESGFWKTTFMGTVVPMVPIAIVALLLVLENHTSGTIILFAIGIIMVLMGEKNHVAIAICSILGITVVVFGIRYLMNIDVETAPQWAIDFTSKYSWKRIEIWLNPDDFDLREDLWQTSQGLNAIGSGGFMGVGFGQSRQKHMFVSQPQNDFIYTIICEELGFVGGVAVVILFLMLALRGYTVGKRITDRFSRYVVWGLCFSISMQAFLNVGVVTNLLPNTGISLPFFSYGGSSIISMMIEMGFILALSRYAVHPAKT